MRSATASPAGFDRVPFECRLRFHRPLKGVEVVPADSIVTAPRPLPPAPPPAPKPEPAPAPVPPPAPAATPAPTVDFSQTELARQLAADRDRIEAVLAEVQGDVAALRKERAAKVEDLQRVAIELAVALAARLLHERVSTGDLAIDAKVRDMIAQLGEEAVSVRLNPADLELLKERLGGEPLAQGQDDPRFIPDDTLNRGACQVDGRESMLLSDVARELRDLRDEMLGRLDNVGS